VLSPRHPIAGQPQVVLRIAPRWLPYKPTLCLVPAIRADVIGGDRQVFANDATIKGGAFEFPGTNGYVSFGSRALVDPWTHTLVMVTQLDSFINSYPYIAAYNTTSTRRAVFYSNDASYSDLVFVKADGAGTAGTVNSKASLSGIASVTGAQHRVVMRANGATSATGASVWVNGVAATVVASSAGASNSGDSLLGQAATGSLTLDFDGRIWLFALFNSALPDALCRELSVNPWALFAPSTNFVPTYVSASSSTTINAGVGTSTAEGLTATVVTETTIEASIGSAVAEGLQAAVVLNTDIAAGVGNAIAEGLQASVVTTTRIEAGIGNATAEGLPATVNVTGSTQINVGVGTATAEGLAATVVLNVDIAAGVGEATASGSAATIVLNVDIAAGIGEASATGLPATVNVTTATSISCGVGTAVASGLQATINVTTLVPGRLGSYGEDKHPHEPVSKTIVEMEDQLILEVVLGLIVKNQI